MPRIELTEVERLALAKAGADSISCNHGWRDIETAPQDGTIVIGYDPKAKKWNVKFMTYHKTQTGGYWRNEVVTGVFNPTHWMPLPKPPQVKQ